MLEKCLVGRLISKTPAKNAVGQQKKPLPIRLRFDFRQPTSKTLRIFIYTNSLKLTPEQIFLCLENEKTFTAYVSIDDFIHTIALGKFGEGEHPLLFIIDLDLELLEPVNNHFNGLTMKNPSFIFIEVFS